MRRSFLAAPSFLLAALLAGCGGDGDDSRSAPTTPGRFSAVVSFGDSLSDAGTYAPATSLAGDGSAPYYGGRFTANSAAARVWVEDLAAVLGLRITPAEVGYGSRSTPCPSADASCTAYGQGGSRVTDPDGINHALGALTVPMKTQIARHLARFGAFRESDLVLLWGGSNDLSVQFEAYTTSAAQVQADQQAGRLGAEQARLALSQAQARALQGMQQAAVELAGYVRDEIVAKGGRYVSVMNLPDPTLTPYGGTLSAAERPVMVALADGFNVALQQALQGLPVKLMDQYSAGQDIYANPAKYGLANNRDAACDAAKIAVVTRGAITSGSSLYCDATPGAATNGLRAGADTATWQFADSVHPTPGGHRVISQVVQQQLKAWGWL